MIVVHSELKGCPRCGNDCPESPCYSVDDETVPAPAIRVECLSCGLEGPEAASVQEAARLWNALPERAKA